MSKQQLGISEEEERSKIIERVENVIEIFIVGVEIGTDKILDYRKQKFGVASMKWIICWFGFIAFGEYYPIEISLYGADDWVDVQICEKAFKFNMNEDERFAKYQKRVSTDGPQTPGTRNMILRPKNKKQLQEILQKLIKYM